MTPRPKLTRPVSLKDDAQASLETECKVAVKRIVVRCDAKKGAPCGYDKEGKPWVHLGRLHADLAPDKTEVDL